MPSRLRWQKQRSDAARCHLASVTAQARWTEVAGSSGRLVPAGVNKATGASRRRVRHQFRTWRRTMKLPVRWMSAEVGTIKRHLEKEPQWRAANVTLRRAI